VREITLDALGKQNASLFADVEVIRIDLGWLGLKVREGRQQQATVMAVGPRPLTMSLGFRRFLFHQVADFEGQFQFLRRGPDEQL
jgi:hypothetical protein